VSVWLARIQENLTYQIKILKTLSPQATLERGYSITFKNKKVLKNIKNLNTGDLLTTRLDQGEFSSTVK